MNRVGLGRQDTLRLVLRDTSRKRSVCDGNVLRDIRNHIDAVLDIFMQNIGAELRIEYASSKKNEGDNQQNRNDSDKQIRNDQAVAQTPQQPVSPPADQPEQKISASKNREIFQEAEKAAAQPEDGG